MKRTRFIAMLAIIMAGMLAMSMPVAAKSRPKVQKIYIFGFSASFTDSLACLTSVQQLDSAWVGPHGFLMDRALYSLQLQYHVEAEYGIKESTCAVFFSKRKGKAEAMRNNILRRYNRDRNVKLREISAEQFQFTAEDYRQTAPVQIETETPEPPAHPQAQPAQ
ncbi:MAG: hypothetical protein J5486_07855 [Bacteroidaceae bacterium]|nr:hypothetical protein [Bacteroidaceae bacterium]